MHPNDTHESDQRRSRVRKESTRVSVDELVAKSHSVFDRVVPLLARAAERLRVRLGRK